MCTLSVNAINASTGWNTRDNSCQQIILNYRVKTVLLFTRQRKQIHFYQTKNVVQQFCGLLKKN